MKNASLFTIIAAIALMAMLAGCDNGKFHVRGVITEAKDSILYFEHMSLDGPVAIDSVKLDEDGDFDFAGENPTGDNGTYAPEFYRLRIGNNIINVSIDSTETVTFKAQCASMPYKYDVEGSDNCVRIKELSLLQQRLIGKVIAINNNSTSVLETRDSIQAEVERYKNYVRENYIFKQPQAASSYFALFQSLGNSLIFNPQESDMDVRTFAAVATAWDTYYSGSDNPEETSKLNRAVNLHNIAVEGLKALHIKQARSQAASVPSDKVKVITLFDIPLVDNHGDRRSLKEFSGKVVLLDFHSFTLPNSTARIMKLREIYDRYHGQGLEIYQVCIDENEHFWKQKTAALPWVCVFDPNGASSEYLQRYNVQQIPTFFLIDKSNSINKRDSQIKDLEKEIQHLL